MNEKTEQARAMVSNQCAIQVMSVEDAPKYQEDTTLVKVTKVIIVPEGMSSGNPSLDFQIEDASGNKYMAMMTGNIFRAIAILANKYYRDGGAPLVE